ncbi:MAG: cold shock domain-containing protein, partial [Alistipes sp.]|nr:cold shock domain-containing protein [Alistipes sp.]
TSHELLNIASYPVAMHDVIDAGIEQNNSLITDLFVSYEPPRPTATVSATPTSAVSEILSLKNGFGFIRYPNNNLFFHSQDVIEGDFTDLSVGDQVTFTIEQNVQKQDVAKNVRKLTSEEIAQRLAEIEGENEELTDDDYE